MCLFYQQFDRKITAADLWKNAEYRPNNPPEPIICLALISREFVDTAPQTLILMLTQNDT